MNTTMEETFREIEEVAKIRKYPEIYHLASNPTLDDLHMVIPDVIYAHDDESTQKMSLIVPWKTQMTEYSTERRIPDKRYPLLIFVQGSGWSHVDTNYELPQLVDYARMGLVVATVSHRNCMDGHPYPAFVQDVKCAIRFLRKNAETYSIDPDRIVIFGSSSGANIALLAGLTADDPEYETDLYKEYSDSVNAVISCFAPCNVPDLYTEPNENLDMSPQIKALYDVDPVIREKQIKGMSPFHLVRDGKRYPPFLLMHGSADPLIYYSQMIKMYHRLYDAGSDVTA